MPAIIFSKFKKLSILLFGLRCVKRRLVNKKVASVYVAFLPYASALNLTWEAWETDKRTLRFIWGFLVFCFFLKKTQW